MAPRSRVRFALLLALCLAAGAGVARAQEEEVFDAPEEAVLEEAEPQVKEREPSAHIVVDKRIGADLLVENREFAVNLNLYNLGDSAAYDIELEDGQWSEHLELAAGSAKAVVKQLAAGENYTHSYKLVAGPATHNLAAAPASVKYRVSSGATSKLTCKSAPMYSLQVLSKADNVKRQALELGVYVSLGMLRTPTAWRNFLVLIAVIGGLLAVNQSILSTRAALRQRKSRKAQKELMKDQ